MRSIILLVGFLGVTLAYQSVSISESFVSWGLFINYIRVQREGGLEKSLHTLTWGEGRGQIHSYVIFSMSIFYIRNGMVKWFGRDHISFASGS